jgi:hypothetical protein
VAENLERQNRFVADNLRRIFVQIYRIVGMWTTPRTLRRKLLSKPCSGRISSKTSESRPLALADRYQYCTRFPARHSRVQYCELDVAPQTSGESPEQIVLRSEHHEYLADGLRL